MNIRELAPNANALQENDQRLQGRAGSLLDKRLLEMLGQAMEGSAEAVSRYQAMSNALISDYDKKTIRGIMLDKVKHRRLFDELYFHLAGARMPQPSPDIPAEQRRSLAALFEEALQDELMNVEFHRQIYFALINLEFRDVLFEITTDGLKHAVILSSLMARYR